MWSQRQHLSPYVILSGLLSLWMDLTSAEINIQLIPQDPVTGGSVTLSVTGVTGKILTFTWFKGLSKDSPYQILTYIPDNPSPLITGDLYFSRATPFPNGSLQISDLHITDSGNYTVRIQTNNSAADVSVNLTVYESPHAQGLDSGAIIGIVVAVLLLVLGASLLYLFVRRKRHGKPLSNKSSALDTSSRNGQTTTTTMEQPELQYADIQFATSMPRKQKQPPGSCENRSASDQTPPEDVLYSDLRLM